MSTDIQLFQNNITDVVLTEIQGLEKNNGLSFPPDYAYENALKSAWLILQDVKTKDGKLALEVCTKESIANSLVDMIIQGLSPAKKQCYFIPFGNKLTLLRSYFGSVAVAKRVAGLKDINAEVIREGQEFLFDVLPKTGIKVLLKHSIPYDTLNNKITGAYAVKQMQDGSFKLEIMTRDDIQKAWNQGQMKGNSPAHQNFESEMCKKSVINRACKIEINASSDSDIVIAAVNRTTETEYESLNEEMRVDAKVEEVQQTEDLKSRIITNQLKDGEKKPEAKTETEIEPEKPAMTQGMFNKLKRRMSEGDESALDDYDKALNTMAIDPGYKQELDALSKNLNDIIESQGEQSEPESNRISMLADMVKLAMDRGGLVKLTGHKKEAIEAMNDKEFDELYAKVMI